MQQSSTPCSACSWTPERQDNYRYQSHVKLFYEMSDRGVWSLGSNLVLKERSSQAPNFEAANLQFLKKETTIPVSTVVEDWEEENDECYFLLMRRIPGSPLSNLWPDLTISEKENIAQQTANYLMQLRKLQSDKLQSLGGKPLYSAFLFQDEHDVPHGPISSDDDLWSELELALEGVPDDARQRLRDRMPSAAPYTFTHGDLASVNIMVDDDRDLAGIIDWEASGYFPVWWEFTSAGIGLGQEDKEWKVLLQKYMPDFSDARGMALLKG
ncbi:kinase-like protein [Aspergillus sclerotioniger CBS 115572]|uniref:Kinase-like protein n=1 Tax=Aspergillus sclerotioniger CBS 115572 TaxID=1450535 RepID=A0A317XAT5_9EURO|nr:kinase-like protein [Aspergillus sclerotioniger CBS 115572]PWY95706.1 kinase-like protein [Aspergillus sclerotioniger CBS 115572]